MSTGDGNGFVECSCGERHWGRHGAAGVLIVRADRSDRQVLLQLRAGWTHLGGTWGIPGGAVDSHEDVLTAALREAHEETGVAGTALQVLQQVVTTDHPEWRYTVVVARILADDVVLQLTDESDELRWVDAARRPDLPMHPGLAASWPDLSALVRSVLG